MRPSSRRRCETATAGMRHHRPGRRDRRDAPRRRSTPPTTSARRAAAPRRGRARLHRGRLHQQHRDRAAGVAARPGPHGRPAGRGLRAERPLPGDLRDHPAGGLPRDGARTRPAPWPSRPTAPDRGRSSDEHGDDHDRTCAVVEPRRHRSRCTATSPPGREDALMAAYAERLRRAAHQGGRPELQQAGVPEQRRHRAAGHAARARQPAAASDLLACGLTDHYRQIFELTRLDEAIAHPPDRGRGALRAARPEQEAPMSGPTDPTKDPAGAGGCPRRRLLGEARLRARARRGARTGPQPQRRGPAAWSGRCRASARSGRRRTGSS